MGSVDTKGLKHFMGRLKEYGKMHNIAGELAEEIANAGKQIAESEYGVIEGEENKGRPIITVEEMGIVGGKKIVAQRKGLRFSEFGTGLVGEGTYPDETKLPTQTFQFISPKGNPAKSKLRTTQGWEYYYPNPDTKIMGGWFAGKTFLRGQKAQHQMYNTSQWLRLMLPEIAKNIMKGGNK